MIKTFFINSTQALYDDAEFAKLQSAIFDAGVLADRLGVLGLTVTERASGGANMSVDVAVGTALVEITKSGRTFKVFVANDAVVNVPIASNSSGSNRVDAIVVRVSVATEPNVLKNNVGTIERVAGTGVSALSDGDITTALGSDGWIRLANVTVANADTSIINSEIADVRSRIELNQAIHITLDALSTRDVTTGSVDQSQTLHTGASAGGQTDTAGGRRRIAQSFTTTKKGIWGFRLWKLANSGTFTGDITFTIEADVANAPSGTPLATHTITNAVYNALPNGASFERLFATQYAGFVSGAKYWLVIVPTTGDSANCPNFGAETGNPYANGNLAYYNTADGWVQISGTDLHFQTLELTAGQIVKTGSDGYIPKEVMNPRKPNIIIFSVAGSNTYTPTAGVRKIMVEVVGAGQGGGRQYSIPTTISANGNSYFRSTSFLCGYTGGYPTNGQGGNFGGTAVMFGVNGKGGFGLADGNQGSPGVGGDSFRGFGMGGNQDNGGGYGGGGYGAMNSGTSGRGGKGGSGGGYAMTWLTAEELGATETVYVGAGGSGDAGNSASGANGKDGAVIITEYFI